MASMEIRYTLDGSEPTINSELYTGPLSIAGQDITKTLKAKAFQEGWTPSETKTAVYNITGTVIKPIINPASGGFATTQRVTITCATPGVHIYYTTNGATPNKTSNAYTGSFNVSSTCIVKAIAYKSNWIQSPIDISSITINGNVSTPTITPSSQTSIEPITCTLACTTSEASIYYTLDGSEPNNASYPYTEPIIVSSSLTVKAKAFKANYGDSQVATASYQITGTISAIECSLDSGVYVTAQSITLKVSPEDSKIYFTMDGSEPTDGGTSILYVGPISINLNSTRTLKAKAFKADWANSPLLTREYTITGKLPTPIFNPDGGTFTIGQVVTITT